MKEHIGIAGDSASDYIEVALALEVLSYHNKNYLNNAMCDNCKRSEEMQWLLREAVGRIK